MLWNLARVYESSGAKPSQAEDAPQLMWMYAIKLRSVASVVKAEPMRVPPGLPEVQLSTVFPGAELDYYPIDRVRNYNRMLLCKGRVNTLKSRAGFGGGVLDRAEHPEYAVGSAWIQPITPRDRLEHIRSLTPQ
ncbi:MAG UNVERIFIED_CONTAM: hypothetical protein LVT10_23950 [Anaerolineae bacterium]|jgi:hypothetical protein